MQIVVRSMKGEKGVKTEDDGIQKVGFLSPSPVCRWPAWVSKYCIEILEYKEEKWCDSPVGTQCPEYYFLTFLLEYFCELLLSNWCCYSYWKAQTTRHVRCGLMGWAAVYTEKQCGGEERKGRTTKPSGLISSNNHIINSVTAHRTDVLFPLGLERLFDRCICAHWCTDIWKEGVLRRENKEHTNNIKQIAWTDFKHDPI